MKLLSNLAMFIEKNYKVIVLCFFIVYLLVGLSVFKDYGISWDDVADQGYGSSLFKHIADGTVALYQKNFRYYGPAFQLILMSVEKALQISNNTKAVYLVRHLVTFLLFFISAIFFYLISQQRFKSWKIALLGSSFLILSPRIFAHSFYNTKDIPFLSFVIICIYTMIMFLKKKKPINALVHSLTCALLVDIRVAGVFIPFFTVLFFGIDIFKEKSLSLNLKKSLGNLLLYIVFFIFFTILFWPALWQNPLQQFRNAFLLMSHYAWHGQDLIVLYQGSFINAENLPWHYIPVWIVITTPLIYTGCFLLGCLSVIIALFKSPSDFYNKRKEDLIFFLCFFSPLISVILLRSVLYDAWRHLFFIYPPFLLISLIGLTAFLKYFKMKPKGRGYKIIGTIFLMLLLFNHVTIAIFMIRYHPFQNVYFNRLAGKNLQEAKTKFEMDYWGLSYRQALEYILKQDKTDKIKIFAKNVPGINNAKIINPAEQVRLEYVKNIEDADYFIDNYRWHPQDYPYKEYYSIVVDQAKIMTVFKMSRE